MCAFISIVYEFAMMSFRVGIIDCITLYASLIFVTEVKRHSPQLSHSKTPI